MDANPLTTLHWHAALTLAGLLTLAGCHHPPSVTRTSGFDARASYAAGTPTQGRCNGSPRVKVAAQANQVKCIALLDDKLVFPRGVVSLGDQLLVVDKGSALFNAQPNRKSGRIFTYLQTSAHNSKSHPTFDKKLLIDNLSHPNGISVWQQANQRFVFVSTPATIWRFNPDAAVPADTLEAVIHNLPTHGWHYLTQIHIHANTLYVSIPSATDHCEAGDPGAISVQYPCSENGLTRTDQHKTAVLREYAIRPDGSPAPNFRLLARGLRDTLAITTDPKTQHVWLADNAWDQIDLSRLDGARSPHDELNLLTPEAHYGWPYCHSDNQLTPLYATSGASCDSYQAPQILLAAHAAPLGMTYTAQQLLINLHGYQPSGRKTVYYNLDAKGLPREEAQTLIDWNYGHEPGYFFGRPFGIAQHGPTQLVITDDWNHALMLVVMNELTSSP